MFLQRTALTLTATLIAATGASAQHSDIEFEFHDGHIDILGSHDHDEGDDHDHDDHALSVLVEDDDHDDHGHGGLNIFEGDFGDFAGGPYSTINPGFAAEDGALKIGSIIGFNAVGPLMYHDGSDFAATDAVVTVVNTIGSNIDISASSFLGSGFIAEADSEAGFHAHTTFSINADAAVGAYMIELTLSAYTGAAAPVLDPTIEDSDSFYIVFNNGLEEDENLPGPHFHDAFEAFEAAVPEPGSAVALLLGAGLVASRRRRK